MASLSTKEAKKLQEQNERRLLALVKLPGNSSCCDCGANGPRWASFNIGCFLCIRCGGIHRRMGTHISKVKSISLDTWKSEQIENMELWGNTKVNELYLYQAKSRPIPSDDDGMEQYIRDKYERKRFFKPGAKTSNPESLNENNKAMSIAIKSLYDMGFTDIEANKKALLRTKLNVNAAIELMCNEEGSNTKSEKNQDPRLAQLKAMGFENEKQNLMALKSAKGSVERAIEILVNNTNGLNNKPSSKASAVLGLDQHDLVKKEVDLFGDFEQAPQLPPKETKSDNNPLDEFGDFSFPAPQSNTSKINDNINSINQVPAINKEEKKNDKDYIMSLFSNVPQTSNNNNNMTSNAFGYGNNLIPTQNNAQAFNNNNNFNNLGFDFSNNNNNSNNNLDLDFSNNNNMGLNTTGYGNNSLNFGNSNNSFSNQFNNNNNNNNNYNNFGAFTSPQVTQSSTYFFENSTEGMFANNKAKNNVDVKTLNHAFESLDPFKQSQSGTKSNTKSPSVITNNNTAANNNNNNDLLDLL